jgi:hypothetical protein
MNEPGRTKMQLQMSPVSQIVRKRREKLKLRKQVAESSTNKSSRFWPSQLDQPRYGGENKGRPRKQEK